MHNNEDITATVKLAMERYFNDLEGEDPTSIYNMVLSCVEPPLIESVLNHAKGNQTRAAELLGMNRNTLRKKMKMYDMI